MEKFEAIYQRICKETDKKAMLSALNEKKVAIIFVILFYLYWVLLFIFTKTVLFITSIAFIIYIIYVLYKLFNPAKFKYKMTYRERYKYHIISKLVKYYDENLSYHPNMGMQLASYRRAGYNPYDSSTSEDYIYGNLSGTLPLKMAELKVYKDVESSEGSTTHFKKFEGLFAQVTLKKSIHSKIFVFKDSLIDGKEIIKTDSLSFNNYYDLYAEDKLLAMRILTSDVIDYILHLREEKNVDFDFTIIDNQLSIRLHCSRMFEPPSQKDFLNKKVLFSYYEALDTIFNLCHKLNEIIEDKEL